MKSWLSIVRSGFAHRLPSEVVPGDRGQQSFWRNLKPILPHVYSQWRMGAAGAAFLLSASLLAFPQPMIIRFLIDDILVNKQRELVLPVLLLWTVVTLGQGLSGLLQDFFFTRFQQDVTLAVQENLLERTLNLPKSFFDSIQSGYLISRLRSDVQRIQWFFSGTLVQAVTQSIRFVGGVALLFYLEWKIAALVIATVPIAWFAARILSDRTYVLSHHALESHAEVSANFQECFSAVPLMKSFAREGDTIQKLIRGMKQICTIDLQQQSLDGVNHLSITVLAALAKLLVLGFGSLAIIKDNWTVGSLLAFLVYLDYVYGPAQFLAGSQNQFQRSRAALERVASLLNMIPENNVGLGEVLKRPVTQINFSAVGFSYNGQTLFERLTFSARTGQKVVISGPSGSGKTTLVSLLLRFYQPTTGEIFYNNRSSTDLETRSIRQCFGYVPQENLLFSGTILDNLRYGNPDASPRQVKEAARKAGIHDFILTLKDGYRTRVGERGVTLSEGQRQRLSIARALVADPDILILDEPTSALDPTTAKEILTSLSGAFTNRILFIVTHRPEALVESDICIELDGVDRVQVREKQQ